MSSLCPVSFSSPATVRFPSTTLPPLTHSVTYTVGGMAQWSERRSVASGLSLIFA